MNPLLYQIPESYLNPFNLRQVVESTLPIHTHAPEPAIFLHDPASSRTAIPVASALKTSKPSLQTNNTLGQSLQQQQSDTEEEYEQEDIGQIKKNLAQDVSFSSSSPVTAPTTTTANSTSQPTTSVVTKTTRFSEGEILGQESDRRRRQESESMPLDQLQSTLPQPQPPQPATTAAVRRGYASTPNSPHSYSPTILYPPPPPSTTTSSPPSQRAISFQPPSKALKKSSTGTHGRSNSASGVGSGAGSNVRFQRGLGSPSVGVSEETEDEDKEGGSGGGSSYPTFASYRQAQHAHFDVFAQRMRRTLEDAAAAADESSANPAAGRTSQATRTTTVNDDPLTPPPTYPSSPITTIATSNG
ncbi:MAG: hypothetical protein J3R72DRAFT_486819 [Linnemannia gamsii]|nr:MAG: hypothetical protein J3R72DRAFT_486819 [Linnemannia gamsii]